MENFNLVNIEDKKWFKRDEVIDIRNSYQRALENFVHEKTIEEGRIIHNHRIDIEKKELEIQKLKDQHAFELSHFESKKVKELEQKNIDLEKKLAVKTQEIESIKAVIDINGDIVDVKDLIGKIINKLPEINLKGITVNSTK